MIGLNIQHDANHGIDAASFDLPPTVTRLRRRLDGVGVALGVASTRVAATTDAMTPTRRDAIDATTTQARCSGTASRTWPGASASSGSAGPRSCGSRSTWCCTTHTGDVKMDPDAQMAPAMRGYSGSLYLPWMVLQHYCFLLLELGTGSSRISGIFLSASLVAQVRVPLSRLAILADAVYFCIYCTTWAHHSALSRSYSCFDGRRGLPRSEELLSVVDVDRGWLLPGVLLLPLA